MMNFYWLFWLVVGFGLPEGIALGTGHPENTLSDTAWRWCQVTPGDSLTHWTFLHILVAGLLLWLFVHISLGIWR